VASAADAVAWGRLRSPSVRIRTGDSRTYWAGTAARPGGFDHTWTEHNPDGGSGSGREADPPADRAADPAPDPAPTGPTGGT
jgi:hypothetical protein